VIHCFLLIVSRQAQRSSGDQDGLFGLVLIITDSLKIVADRQTR